ncbi:hypothetical protein Trydic_g14109 [Trypoxylus dichotomus]
MDLLYCILSVTILHSADCNIHERLSNLYTTNFCRHKCGFKYNICCVYKSPEIAGPLCRDHMEAIEMLESDRLVVLDAFNKIRNLTAGGEAPRVHLRGIYAANMHILSYSKQLEYTAACWAKQCRLNHSRCRANEYGAIGEAICWKLAESSMVRRSFHKLLARCPGYYMNSYPDIHTKVIDSVTFPTMGDDERNRETTQLLWAETKYVGCFAVSYPHVVSDERIVLLVCHFAPAGNVIGKSVFTRGKPCTECPLNVPCSSLYKNLCGSIRPFKQDMWIPPLKTDSGTLMFTVKVYYFVIFTILLVKQC